MIYLKSAAFLPFCDGKRKRFDCNEYRMVETRIDELRFTPTLILLSLINNPTFTRAKTEYDHESSVDNINVSVCSKSSSNQMSDVKPALPFATSWISAVYSKGW